MPHYIKMEVIQFFNYEDYVEPLIALSKFEIIQ